MRNRLPTWAVASALACATGACGRETVTTIEPDASAEVVAPPTAAARTEAPLPQVQAQPERVPAIIRTAPKQAPVDVFAFGEAPALGDDEALSGPALFEKIAELTKAEARAPGDWQLPLRLARLFHRADRPAEAADAYRRVLRLRPESDEAAWGLAGVLLKAGRREEAIDALEALATRRPEDIRVRKALADARRAGGDVDGALAALVEAARVAPPGDASAHAELGSTLAAAGRFADAVAPLTEAAKRRPEDARLHFQLGTVLAQAGRLREAEGSLSRSTAIAPGDALAWRNLAATREQLGDAEGAARAYEGLIASVPGADADGQLAGRVEALRTKGLAGAPASQAAPASAATER